MTSDKRYLEFDPRLWKDPCGVYSDFPTGAEEISGILHRMAEDFMRKEESLSVMTILGFPGNMIFLSFGEVTEESKQRLANMTRLVTSGYDVAFTVVLSEMWIAIANADETQNGEMMAVPPSERHDRREGIFISIEWPGGKKLMQMCAIERDLDGKCIGLSGLKVLDCEIAGRFSGLFAPRPIDSVARDLARQITKAFMPTIHADLVKAEAAAKRYN